MISDKKVNCCRFSWNIILVNALVIFYLAADIPQTDATICRLRNNQVGRCTKLQECRSAILLQRKGFKVPLCSSEARAVCCTDNFDESEEDVKHDGQTQEKYSHEKGSGENESEEDLNKEVRDGERKKHSIEGTETDSQDEHEYGDKIVNNYRKNKEELYSIEKRPNNLYSETADSDKHRQGNRRNKYTTNNYYEDTYHLPPGLAKKNPWRDEEPSYNEYQYERVTKRTNYGPSRKGSGNQNDGSSYYDSNSPSKRPYEENTKRNDYYDQGIKRTTSNYDLYDNENQYHNTYNNHRGTTKANKWTQETYTTTRRNEYSGNRPDDTYSNNSGDGYYNEKPSRRPQPASRPSNNQNRPYPEQENRPYRPDERRPYPTYENIPYPQDERRPNPSHENSPYPQQENRPYPQDERRPYPQDERRPYPQQGSRPQVDKRPSGRPGTQRRRISELKCEEYTRGLKKNVTGLPLSVAADPLTISVSKCVQAQELIVGGENASLGEFPHMAAIGFLDRNKKISWSCGGTLISEEFVMTAAHCASTNIGRPLKVRLGEYNLMKNDDGARPVDYAIKQIIIHPDYKPPSKYNDIALLKLSRRVTFFDHIRPACLYSENRFSVTTATATGWGRVQYDGDTSDILKKVSLKIVDNYTCSQFFKSSIKTSVLSKGIVESQMCAGEVTGGKDTCQGDSGGPLSIVNPKCIHHVIGITSFGKSCALPNSTGVYTRVSAFISWIESIVWP